MRKNLIIWPFPIIFSQFLEKKKANWVIQCEYHSIMMVLFRCTLHWRSLHTHTQIVTNGFVLFCYVMFCLFDCLFVFFLLLLLQNVRRYFENNWRIFAHTTGRHHNMSTEYVLSCMQYGAILWLFCTIHLVHKAK